jgi:hypothetical protein
MTIIFSHTNIYRIVYILDIREIRENRENNHYNYNYIKIDK